MVLVNCTLVPSPCPLEAPPLTDIDQQYETKKIIIIIFCKTILLGPGGPPPVRKKKKIRERRERGIERGEMVEVDETSRGHNLLHVSSSE